MCWVAGAAVGFLPLFGWHADSSEHLSCFFVKVMDYNFLVFLYFATIITPALIMAAFYAHIYRVVIKQLKQIVTVNPEGGSSKKSGDNKVGLRKSCGNSGGNVGGGGTMLRVLGAAQKREVKATQNLSIIVLFFMICWIPLYTINCIKAFCPDCHIEATWTDFCIILSHLNSAVNPLLYAYHLRDFRAALKSFIYKMFRLKETTPPNENYYKPSIMSHAQRNMSYFEKRTSNAHSQQCRVYVDSPVWLRQHASESGAATIAGPSTPTSGSSAPPNTGFPRGVNLSPNQREMRRISEVPSVSERDISHDVVSTISRNEGSKSAIQSSDDEYDDEDDEVFLSSPIRLVSVTEYNFNNRNDYVTDLPFDDEKSSRSSSWESEYESILDNTEDNAVSKNCDFNVEHVSKLPSSQTDPMVFCVENNNCGERSTKIQDILDLPSVNLVANSRKVQIVSKDNNCECSPCKKPSPLKIVGDFLFHQTTNKTLKRGMVESYKSRKQIDDRRRTSLDAFQYLDLQKNNNLIYHKNLTTMNKGKS